MPRVLLFDADGDTAGIGLERMLSAEAHEVRVVGSSGEILAALSDTPPELIILAVEHPERCGTDLIHAIRARDTDVAILVRAPHADEADRVVALRAGADDVVLHSCGLMEVLARVDALTRRARRCRGHQHATIGFADVRVDTASGTVTKGGRRVHLKPKEFELLAALLRDPGVVVPRQRLLRDVWDHRAAIVTRTIDAHIFSLRRKLEDVPESPRHIITVRSRGIRFDP